MSTTQPALFGPAAANSSGLRDSAFAGNRELPIHRWVPWVAGFSAHFVDDCLSQYLTAARRADSWVLDPFSGVGTTLVQAYTRGFNAAGFEINPYAALASRMKLEAARLDLDKLSARIGEFERVMKRRSMSAGGQPRSEPPAGFTGRTQLFSPAVERKVLFALDFIHDIEEPAMQDLFRLALGSVMVSFSNYSYEPSLTRRAAVGREPIHDAEVGTVIALKLKLMQTDAAWLQQQLSVLNHKPKATVIGESFFQAPAHLDRESVDLVITSPPYLNNYHYPRNTRPQLHWLGFSSGTGYGGAREDSSFGKFWQSVRDKEEIPLAFRLPRLKRKIGEIRARNTEKGAYGGPGWANYVATYFNDTHRFCSVLTTLLKPGAAAVIVLGNSIIQGVEVGTDYTFGEIAELAGLKFENRILLRQKRTGASIIQSSVRTDKAAAKATLYESAIVLRKGIGAS